MMEGARSPTTKKPPPVWYYKTTGIGGKGQLRTYKRSPTKGVPRPGHTYRAARRNQMRRSP